MRRVLEDGEKPSEVMRSLGLCRTTIYRWLRGYREGGSEALNSTKASGPEPKLDEKQRIEVRRWILGKDPRQYGFDFGLWTRSRVGPRAKILGQQIAAAAKAGHLFPSLLAGLQRLTVRSVKFIR